MYCRPKKIEEQYDIPAGTLSQRRHRKLPPKWYKVGRSVYYRSEDVEEWLKSLVQEPEDKEGVVTP